MPRCQHAIATTMTLLMPLVVVVCASVARLAADTFANDSQAEVASLVAELGAPEFFRRERATEKLLKIGLPAVSLLEQGAGHHDREIRYRCRRILVLVHENDRRNRLDAFVAGSHNEDDLDLPGWSQFASRFGSSPDARTLFAALLQAEWPLLQTVYADDVEEEQVAQLVSERCRALAQARRTSEKPSLGSIAALLLAAVDCDATMDSQTLTNLYSLCYQQEFQNAIQTGSRPSLVRKLLGAWIQHGRGQFGEYHGLTLALRFSLQEGLASAERALSDNNAPANVKQIALVVIAKLGGAEQFELLEQLLDDPSAIQQRVIQGRRVTQTQTRDLALAALIHLHKLSLREYGFPRARMNAQSVFDLTSLGFLTSDERDQALQKWQEFKSRQK